MGCTFASAAHLFIPRFCSSARVFGWREEDEHGQVLCDAVEMMLHICSHEDEQTRLNRHIFRTHLYLCLSPHHVIEFIFSMWLLWVNASCRQLIYPGAHSWNVQELVIKLTVLLAGCDQIEEGKQCAIHKNLPVIRSR